jgi:hypothetical protein
MGGRPCFLPIHRTGINPLGLLTALLPFRYIAGGADSEGPGPVLEGVHLVHHPPGSHTEDEAAGEGRRWDSSGEEISAAVQPSLAGEQHPSLLTKAAVVGGPAGFQDCGRFEACSSQDDW